MVSTTKKDSDGHILFTKLDRILVNEARLSILTESQTFFAPPGISDYSPGIVMVRPEAKHDRMPFNFFNF